MQQEITLSDISSQLKKIDERLSKQESTIRGLYDFTVKKFAQIDGRLDGIESRLDGIETRLDRVESRLDDMQTQLNEATSILREHANMFLEQNMAIYKVGHQVLEVTSKLHDLKVETERHGKILEDIEAHGSFLRARFFKTMAVVTTVISLIVSGSFNLAFNRS